MTPQNRNRATWAAACVSLVAGFEGLRTVAYRDPVGIPTVCYGETLGVRMGDAFTPTQCKEMLEARLVSGFYAGAVACVPNLAMQQGERIAAHVSLAYNIGVGAYCQSSVARLANAGHWAESCDAFLKFRFATAGGVKIPLPGLLKRRERERQYCRQAA